MPSASPSGPTSTATPGKSRVTPEDLLLVDQMILNGRYEDALVMLQQLQQLEPDNAQVKKRLGTLMGEWRYAEGRSLFAQGFWTASIEKLKEAVGYLPGDSGVLNALDGAYLGLARDCLEQLDAESAKAALLQVTHDANLKPLVDSLLAVDVPAVAATKLGYDAFQRGDYSAALRFFQEALRIKPDLTQAQVGLQTTEEMIAQGPSPTPTPSPSPSPTVSPEPTPTPSPTSTPPPTPSPSPSPTSSPFPSPTPSPSPTPTAVAAETPEMRWMDYGEGSDWGSEKSTLETPEMRSMGYGVGSGWLDVGTELVANPPSTPSTAPPSAAGAVSLGQGGWLEIPPGSLEPGALLQGEIIPPPSSVGVLLLGPCFRIQFQGATPSSSIDLFLPAPIEAGDADVLRWNGSNWEMIGAARSSPGILQASLSGSAVLAVGIFADLTLAFRAAENGYSFANLGLPESPNGVCAGMAATVAWSIYPNFAPIAQEWSALPGVWQEWILQTQLAYAEDWAVNYLSPLDNLNRLQAQLSSGQAVFVALADAAGGKSGHAVVAFGLQHVSSLPGYRIAVYDPNYPGEEGRKLALRKEITSGRWTMEVYDETLQGFHAMDRHEIGLPPVEIASSLWTLRLFENNWDIMQFWGRNAICTKIFQPIKLCTSYDQSDRNRR